jgi:Tol biopolymer transport system component
VALAQTRGTLAAPAGADEKSPAQVPVQPAAAAPAAGQRADGKAAGTVTARKLWDGLAQQPFSAVSPDGRHLTYMDPSGYLAVRDVVTGKDRRLTPKGFGDGGAYPGSNVFSPDGRQVAYSWYDPPAPRELRLIAFDGSQDRLLYRNEEVPSLWPSAWTPDGKSLVALFQRKDKTYQIALVAVADGAMRVLKSFPDWRRPERVSLSPDGRYLLYDFPPQADARQTDLFLLAIDGSRETAVAEHPSHDLALGWAPDGKQILFSSGRSETGRPEGNLWLLPVADGKAAGEPVRVPGDLSWGMPIGIARDGSYYFTRHSSTVDVHVASLHPTTRKLVVPPTPAGKLYGIEGRIDFFNWSLDGQQLVYQRRAGELVIRSAASGAERVLKPDLGQMYLLPHYSQVCWSPDGRSLFASPYNPKDGQRRLVGVRIDAQTGQVTPFTPALELVQSEVVAFSPDGKSLFRVQHEADSSRLLMRDLGTGQEKEMLQLKKPHGITFPCLSPDGRKLAFRSTESTPDVKLQSTRLMVMPVTGGEPREVLRLQMPDYIPGFSGMFVWTSDGRDLLFVNGGARDANAERGFQLWRVPAEGGAPENLGVAMPHLKHLRIHPDGKQIAFLGGESGTEFWVLENLWPARK